MAKLKQYARGEALRFHLRSLETGVLYDDRIPESRPRRRWTSPKQLCTVPRSRHAAFNSLRGGFFDTQQRNMEAGLPPIPPAICAHAFPGAVLVRPRAVHPGQEPSAPLRASGAGDGFLYGYGLFSSSGASSW